MEGADFVAPFFSSYALRADPQEIENDFRKGADGSAAATGSRRPGSTACVGIGSAGGYILSECRRGKAGTDDGIDVRVGLQTFSDEAESATAIKPHRPAW